MSRKDDAPQDGEIGHQHAGRSSDDLLHREPRTAPFRKPGGSHFDVVVIGATSDGVAIAEAIVARGARVALIDHDPATSRFELAWAMVRRSLVTQSAVAAVCGSPPGSVHPTRADARVQFSGAMRAAELERNRRSRSNAASMTILDGPARFLSDNTLRVGAGLELQGDAFVIATGSRSRKPTDRFSDSDAVLTAPALLGREDIPRSLAILGADWSGCEWAHATAMLGCTVQLIDRRTRLLRSLDAEIRTLVQTSLHQLGVEITLGEEVHGLARDAHGAIRLELASGRTEVAEAVLLLSGELGNTADLGLTEAGVAVDPQGHVLVDDRGRSTVPSILAVGSAVDSSGLFASPSAHIIRLAGNALGGDDTLDSVVPWNLYTDPPVAACGLTAESCLRLDLRVVIGRHEGGGSDGRRDLLQIVVDSGTSRVLGAQASGTKAFSIVQHVAQTINREEPLDAMIKRLTEIGLEPTAMELRHACLNARTKIVAARRGQPRLRLKRD